MTTAIHPFTGRKYNPGDLLIVDDVMERALAQQMAIQWHHFKKVVHMAMERAATLENGYGDAALTLMVTRRVRDSEGNVIQDQLHVEEIGIPIEMVQ